MGRPICYKRTRNWRYKMKKKKCWYKKFNKPKGKTNRNSAIFDYYYCVKFQEEVQKLAAQIEFMKIVHMEMNNRHLKPKLGGYFSAGHGHGHPSSSQSPISKSTTASFILKVLMTLKKNTHFSKAPTNEVKFYTHREKFNFFSFIACCIAFILYTRIVTQYYIFLKTKSFVIYEERLFFFLF